MSLARRRAGRGRSATWLAALGGVLVALGVLGVWAQRTLGDPATFAALAGEILEQPEVRTQLAIVIVDPVLEDAPVEIQQQRPLIVSTTASVLGDDRFVPVFEGVLRRATVRLLHTEGAVHLELEEPLRIVAADVEAISPALAAELAAIDPPQPEVLSDNRADALRGFIALERAVSVAVLVAGGVLAVIAVVRSGGGALLPFGAALAGGCLVLFGALLAGRGILLAGIEPSARAEAAAAAWDVVVSDLQAALLLSAGAGAVAVVAGGVVGRRS
jgi:hypothetical protein